MSGAGVGIDTGTEARAHGTQLCIQRQAVNIHVGHVADL